MKLEKERSLNSKFLQRFRPRWSPGQTLVEIIIATGVVVVVMVAIASGLSYSVKNTAESRYKALATALGQEVIEVYRRERETLGWERFYTAAPSGTYCLNTLPSTTQEFSTLAAGACATGIAEVGTEFKRQVDVTSSSSTVRLDVSVSWYDGGLFREVILVQEFHPWDAT